MPQLLLVLLARPAAGTVFLGAAAAYTLARQVLFRYRDEPRRTSSGRRASMIAAGLVLIAGVVVGFMTGRLGTYRRRQVTPSPAGILQGQYAAGEIPGDDCLRQLSGISQG